MCRGVQCRRSVAAPGSSALPNLVLYMVISSAFDRLRAQLDLIEKIELLDLQARRCLGGNLKSVLCRD